MLARFASGSYAKPIVFIALVMFVVLGFTSAFYGDTCLCIDSWGL